MEMYLFESARFEQLYNCSTYSVDQVPLEERRQLLLGTLSILVFIVFELLYIPCLPALWRHSDEQCCYKIMFFIGVVDVFGLALTGLITGIFGIQGIVYCSHPRMVFAFGIAGNFLYALETTASVLLAASRCLELTFPKLANTLFEGRQTLSWICLVFLYSIYYCFFGKVILFNSGNFAWLFNPHVGYLNVLDDSYTSLVDLIHESSVLALTILFYSFFIISLLQKRLVASAESSMSNVQNSKRSVFLQIFLISCLNSMNTTAYILLSVVQVNPIVFMILGTFGWQLLHGLPPLIYLGVNRTLRKECVQMVKSLGCWMQVKKPKKSNIKNTNVSPIVQHPYLINGGAKKGLHNHSSRGQTDWRSTTMVMS